MRDSIVTLASVSTCGDVTAAHLSAIDSLRVNSASLTALKAGDFSGLTGLAYLDLRSNQLNSLPDGLFDDLTALTGLHLGDNQFTSIPSQLFTLTNLTHLYLWDNPLTGTLPQSLTMLTMLENFHFGGGGLCAPSDAAFQMWLQGIEDANGPTCSQ